jgi:hypothetical protein
VTLVLCRHIRSRISGFSALNSWSLRTLFVRFGQSLEKVNVGCKCSTFGAGPLVLPLLCGGKDAEAPGASSHLGCRANVKVRPEMLKKVAVVEDALTMMPPSANQLTHWSCVSGSVNVHRMP